MGEVWDDVEDGDIDLDEEGVVMLPPPAREPVGQLMQNRGRRQRRGNTHRDEAPFKRSQVVAEAQGKGHPEPDLWREQLAAGERGKAAATIGTKRLTHNSGSGFGLA